MKVSPTTISELNKKAYIHIEDWRNRPLQGGKYPYVYVDGIYLRRNWGGEYENVAILVAIAVNEDGYREVLGAAEGMKEDKASWVSFFQWLRGRGLDGVKLIVGDKCLGMLEAVGEVFPEAKYQRCTVYFYRNVFSVVPRSKVKLVAKMLKAIHAQESKKAAREKAKAVVAQLRELKQLKKQHRKKYAEVTADAGYESLENYLYLEENGQLSFIKPTNYEVKKTKRFKEKIGRIENMAYDETEDCFTCVQGRKLSLRRECTELKHGQFVTSAWYRCEDCGGCPKRNACCQAKDAEKPKEVMLRLSI